MRRTAERHGASRFESTGRSTLSAFPLDVGRETEP